MNEKLKKTMNENESTLKKQNQDIRRNFYTKNSHLESIILPITKKLWLKRKKKQKIERELYKHA